MILSLEMLIHLDQMDPWQLHDAMLLMRRPHHREIGGRPTNIVLAQLPTLRVGHTDDLKLEWMEDACTGTESGRSMYRYWVSRMTKEDGARFDREVTLEHRYIGGGRDAWGWRQFSHGPLG